MQTPKINSNLKFNNVTLSEINEISDKVTGFLKDIKEESKSTKLLLLYGEMGAGKTTFIKNLCAVLGVSDNVSSPTFALMHEYKAAENSIFHFDLHRLKNIQEALDFGIFDYLDSDKICIIEWPQIIEEILEDIPNIKVKISADYNQPEMRNFEIEICK